MFGRCVSSQKRGENANRWLPENDTSSKNDTVLDNNIALKARMRKILEIVRHSRLGGFQKGSVLGVLLKMFVE